jgi:hypothetical protein
MHHGFPPENVMHDSGPQRVFRRENTLRPSWAEAQPLHAVSKPVALGETGSKPVALGELAFHTVSKPVALGELALHAVGERIIQHASCFASRNMMHADGWDSAP